MKQQLTKEKVQNETRPGEYADGMYGLWLRVGKSGVKSWRVRAKRKGGGTVTVTLGKFPAMTLLQARGKALAEFNRLKEGENPNETRRQKRKDEADEKQQAKAKTEAEEWTLARAWKAYTQVYAEKRSRHTLINYEQYLKTHLKNWADRPLSGLTEMEILKRHAELKAATTAATARQAMSVLSSMYAFSMKHPFSMSFIKSNPVKVLRRMEQVAPSTPREQIIEESQLAKWVSDIGKFDEAMRDVLLFMLLTGVRVGGATTLEWRYVDLEARQMSVQNKGHIRNGGKRLLLPITEYVRALLKRRKEEATNDYVFNAVNTPHVYFQYQRFHKKLTEWGVPKFSPHTVRHTYSTVAAEVCPEAVHKRLMGHGGKSDVTQHHYTHIQIERLLFWAQKVEDAILQAAGIRGDNPKHMRAGRKSRKTNSTAMRLFAVEGGKDGAFR